MFADILSLVELPIFPNSIRLRVLFHYFSDVATFQTKTSQFSLPLKWMHNFYSSNQPKCNQIAVQMCGRICV